jgi:hypothetical protein
MDVDMFSAIDEAGRGYPKLIVKARDDVFPRYVERWGEIDRAWRVLAIEEEYSIRLGDLFGIKSTWSLDQQRGAADSLGLTHPRIGVIVERGDLEVRPSIRVDIALERQDGGQQIMDYKSTIGQWGKIPKWSDNNDYGLAWQPYEYSYIARNVRDATGQLVFPRLEGFLIQRILTKDPEYQGEPLTSDRNAIKFTSWVYQLVPYLIARQVARRATLHEQIKDSRYVITPDGGPMPTGLVTGACHNRFGLCDYFIACRSDNPEGIISQSFYVDGSPPPQPQPATIAGAQLALMPLPGSATLSTARSALTPLPGLASSELASPRSASPSATLTPLPGLR